MTSRVSKRWQITIDRKIRQELGVQPGMVAYQRVVNGRLLVSFLPLPHSRSLFGVFHRPGEEPKVVNSEQLEEAVMEAIAEELEQQGRCHG